MVVVVVLAGLICCRLRCLGFGQNFHSLGRNLSLSCQFLQNLSSYLLSFVEIVIVVVVDVAVVVVEVPLSLRI